MKNLFYVPLFFIVLFGASSGTRADDGITYLPMFPTTTHHDPFPWGDNCLFTDVTLNDDGTLEVTQICSSQYMYPEGGRPPGSATKYIYSAKDGKIYLKERKTGSHFPESKKTIPERIEWDGEKDND